MQVNIPAGEAADIGSDQRNAEHIKSAKQIISKSLLQYSSAHIKSMVAHFDSSAILPATNTISVTGYVQIGGSAVSVSGIAKKVPIPQCTWTIMSGGLGKKSSSYLSDMKRCAPWITLNVIGDVVLKRGGKPPGSAKTGRGEVGDLTRKKSEAPPPLLRLYAHCAAHTPSAISSMSNVVWHSWS